MVLVLHVLQQPLPVDVDLSADAFVDILLLLLSCPFVAVLLVNEMICLFNVILKLLSVGKAPTTIALVDICTHVLSLLV